MQTTGCICGIDSELSFEKIQNLAKFEKIAACRSRLRYQHWMQRRWVWMQGGKYGHHICIPGTVLFAMRPKLIEFGISWEPRTV